MRKLLFIFFLFPLLAHSQQTIITGLGRFIVSSTSGGGSGSTGVAIDYSYELRADSGVVNITYNPLRPNIQETVTGSLSFFMNFVPDGFGGNVRFIYTIPPIVNGILTTAFPSGPATVTKTYNKTTGNPLTWN